HPSRPAPPPLERISHVTLVGQGNVSLDVARMLLTPPSVLAKYDVPKPVLEVLERSNVQHVSILGRRGPFQAAFTTKELREMMNLPGASMVPLDPAYLTAPEGSLKLTRQQSRTLQLLQKGSNNKPGTTKKTWSLDFFRSPTGLTTPNNAGDKARLSLGHTILDPSNRAVPTGETSTLETDLVITSLGHHAEPSAPWYDPSLNHLRTLSGRVVDAGGRIVRNVYASGWAATGARGVLVSTMMDAYAVADTILRDHFPEEDVHTTPISESDAGAGGGQDTPAAEAIEVLPKHVEADTFPPEVEAWLREGRVTDFEDWKAVDAEEVRRGEAMGKERERMVWEEAREFLASTRPRNIMINTTA
ncbi:NADPH:adrenodoxin oxidoreductase, mitochondrial, partial [Trametes pubescens]